MRVLDRIRPTVLWVLAHCMAVSGYGICSLSEESQIVTVATQIALAIAVLGRKIVASEVDGAQLAFMDRIRPTVALITTCVSALAVLAVAQLSDPDYIVTVVAATTLALVGLSSDIVESEAGSGD